MNDTTLEYILDFLAAWHGLKWCLSKDDTTVMPEKHSGYPVQVTRISCEVGDGEYFHEFEGTRECRFKQAIDFIVDNFGWPCKSDVIRDTIEEYEDQKRFDV